MSKALMVVALLVSGVLACTKKPVEQTTIHTDTSTTSNTGEVKKSDTTTTTTDKADGTQTVESTTKTQHTVPAPATTH